MNNREGSVAACISRSAIHNLVGMAASIRENRNTIPRGVYEKHLDELKKLVKG